MTDLVVQMIKRLSKGGSPLKLVGRVLSVVTLIYVFYFIASLISTEEVKGISIYLIVLMIVFVFFSSGLIFMNAYVFKIILSKLCQVNIPYRVVSEMYVVSNIYKYLPGNIMHYVSRNILASKYDVSQKSIFQATVYEILLIVMTWILFIVSAYTVRQGYSVVGIVILIAVAYLFMKKGLSKIFLLSFVLITAYNSVFVALFAGYMKEPFSIELVDVALVQSISWLAGFLTPGAPGGVGIKEFVLIQTSPVKWIEGLAIVAVIHRVVIVLTDVLSYCVYVLWKKYFIKTISSDDERT